MKKVLLLIMLCPLMALSQNNLVTWNSTSQPTGLTNMTAQAIAGGGGVIIDQLGWAGGFQLKDLDWDATSTSINTAKYVQFRANPNSGYQIKPTQFELITRSGDAEARKLEVRVSNNGTTWTSLTNATSQTVFNVTTSAQTYTLNFPANYVVLPAQTLYVRIYYYDFTNNYYTDSRLLNTGGSPTTPGPILKGTVTPAGGVLADNDSATMMQNGSTNIDVLYNDVATNTDYGTVTIDTQSLNGVATPQPNKTITFVPTTGFTGNTTFKYKVTGTDGSTATATVTITVTPFIAPTAVNDVANTIENAPVTIAVLSNDTMGTSNTVASITRSTPAKGTTSLTADNKIIYTPTAGLSGSDSFTYTITDGNGKTGTATVNVTIIGFVPPTAGNDSATTGQNLPVTVNVLSNDTAGQGTITGITITGQPSSGTATLNGNRIVYTPTASFTGNTVITYKVNDSNNKSATATLTVTVVAIVAPTAVNDNASTARKTPITLNVTANDNAGNSPIATVVIASNAAHGTLTVNNNNSITYIPDNNHTGADSFTYTVKNGYNATSTATVSLNVLQQANANAGPGPLCGIYTIGTGGDFTTITAAVTRLNQDGVACPVTFLFKNASYTSTTESFPLIFNNVSGNSAVNTITFKPAESKNVNIQVNDIEVDNNNYQAVAAFILNGSSNIIFDGSNMADGTTRNLTVNNNNTIGHLNRAVFYLGDGCNNITIKNTNIRQGIKNNGERFCTGVYIGRYDITGILNGRTFNVNEANAAISNINVTNNDFMNVKQGVYVNGGTGSANATNIVIHQNDLGAENNLETIIQPTSFNNVNGFEYTENLVYNLYRDNDHGNLISSGVYVVGASKNGNIRRNNMRDITRTAGTGSAFAGVTLNSSEANSNIIVANNFILNVTAAGSGAPNQNGHGIYVITGGGYKIYHNTVSLNTNQNGGYSAGLYVGPAATALDVRNNIFANNQTNGATRRTAITVENTPDNINTVFTHLDYNNYYSTDKIGFINTTGGYSVSDSSSPGYLTTFSAWKSTTGKDTHTVEFNPVFASASDLHLVNGNTAIDNEGTFVTAITKDIDGQIRSTTKPSIGADEYGEIVAPEPGYDDGVYCATSTTWNGTAWSNGEPSINKDVVFTGNYTQIGGTLFACSIFVEGTAQVNFISNSNAVVQHNTNVKATATLTFESNSNLIQVETTQNVGNATVKRNSSKLKRLDYTLWSSPVTGQMLKPFSPATDENRFYYYNNATDQYTTITAITTTPFAIGTGYLIRMPNSIAVAGYNAGNTSVVYNGIFKGVPHNGNIRIPLSYGYVNNSQGQSVLRQYNAVGNPYPSPISVSDFIDANIDNIYGTLYLWRKTNDPTKSSYSTVTKIGYTANNAPGGGGSNGNGGNDLIADPFAINSKGVLNTGQGFIVRALTNKDLVFKNNMRVSNNMGTFFRSAEEQQGTVGSVNRMWLNVTNGTDAFSQTLVAYTPDATTGYDNGFDGDALLDGGITLYSLADTHKLTIQARPEFTMTDVVKLGFKSSVAGNFTVAIDSLDGMFNGLQHIYLKDNETGLLHNLKDGNYTFTSAIGTFETRFEIVYTNAVLGVDEPVAAPKDIIVYNNDKKISIQAPQPIKAVTVYDMLGKVIYQNNNIDAQDFSTPAINAAQQVLIVNIILDNDQAATKKIMMN